MQELAERTYFALCVLFGRLLRGAKYSEARVVSEGGELLVRKRRAFYAPLLVWLGGILVRVLATGIRVLPQRPWAERERDMYERLYDAPVLIAADGALMLPRLPGHTLAALLEDPAISNAARQRAIELAVLALSDLHARGFTHADAMAENAMVDLEAGVARWFDFETVHDPARAMTWRRADDVRALLASCLVRTAPDNLAETLDRIVDIYADDAIVPLLVRRYSTVFRRALPFHLGQAALSLASYREIGRLLRRRRHSPLVV